MQIDNFLENIDAENLKKFLNATNSDITIKKDVNRVVADTSWIDMIEESIPYLDNIIRNPRRFIVQEENIVPIAKAKVVTEESIKHLAQHTGLIQEVKEDGSIIPEKLLNVYREETFDLYENRFIKSLIDNLYVFVTNKLNESDQKSFGQVKNDITYRGNYQTKNENVSINLTLNSTFNDEVNNSKDGHSLEDRIRHIQDVIASFKSSTFIKGLKEAAPVRSPIRKTNTILKEPNFMKALDLWEYLEKNNIKPFTKKEKYTEEVKDENIKKKYDVGFFIDIEALKNASSPTMAKAPGDINKVIYDYVFKNKVSEAEFKKLVMKEYKDATTKKEKMVSDIKAKFKDLVSNYDKNKKKAMLLLK